MKYVALSLLLVFTASCSPTMTATATPSAGWYGQPSSWVPTEQDWTPPGGSPDAYKLRSAETFEDSMIPISAIQSGDPKIVEENGEVWIDFVITKCRLAPDLNPRMLTELDKTDASYLAITGVNYGFYAGHYCVIHQVDIDTGNTTSQVEVIPTVEVTEVTQTPVIPSEITGCSDPALTPEEAANCGQHIYRVEGEQVAGDCYYKLEDGSRVQSFSKEETYTIIFEPGTMRTIGKNGESISFKVGPNTYEFREEDAVSLTTFTLDGWIDEFTWGDCRDIEEATRSD